MTEPGKSCILFLTHYWDHRLARHVARFRREAGRALPVHLVYQAASAATVPASARPDIVVTKSQIADRFPLAYAPIAAGESALYDNIDLVWLTALADPLLSDYEHFWIVEYDVDYSGDWGDFFRALKDEPGDLLGTYLRRRNDEPDWRWLVHVRDPAGRPEDHVMGFFPIVRLSRCMATAMADSETAYDWRGHIELRLPTLAMRSGLSIADIGGWGPFTPRARWGRHYEGDWRTQTRAFHTFGFGPPMQHYYAESRLGYWDRGRLYHPVKTGLTGRTAVIVWWVKFRDGTRRRLGRLFGHRVEPSSKAPAALRPKS